MSIKNKIFLAYVIIFGSIFLLILVSSTNYCNLELDEKEFTCGVVDETPKNLKEGRNLFKSQCASCHKLNKKFVGPALGNIEIDSLQFKQLVIDKNKHQKMFLHLSEQNMLEIFNYINQKKHLP